MALPSPSDLGISNEALIGWALFCLSELVGLSRLRDNSLLQLLLRTAGDLFPYEIHRRELPPPRSSRRRDRHGRFIHEDEDPR